MALARDPDPRFESRALATIVDQHPHMIAIARCTGEVVYLNPAARRMVGGSADAEQATIFELHPEIDHATLREEVLPALLRGEPWQGGLHITDHDGNLRELDVTAFGITYPDESAPRYVAAAMQDVTERHRAAADAARSRAQSAAAERIAGLGYWEWEIASGESRWSAEVFRIFGREVEAGPLGATGFLACVHPDDRESVGRALADSARTGEPYEHEFRFLRDDGTVRVIRAQAAVEADARGVPLRIVGVNFDVTEQRELEAQLRAADRLGAVGQLAGGIAHDFNNIMTAISGNAELSRRSLAPDDPIQEDLDQILEGCRRASMLTRQLLAFSGRQLLEQRVVDLNAVIEDLHGMLRRLIPENVGISIRLQPELPSVRADVSQLEQVVLNLALNARDAMPDGGELQIETRLLEPRVAGNESRILLRIADTGLGMEHDVREHAFEPFFTTKAPGRGSGMGLATVYGIIQQSAWRIAIDSEPGKGTTVDVHLSICGEPPQARPEPVGDLAVAGTETILVVEDEAAVRELAVRCLEAVGYEVLVASDGLEAMTITRAAGQKIDLLLTDVVLPGMDGHELARRVIAGRPEVRVLYMSGYPGEVIADHGVVGPEIHFLRKPFSLAAISRKVRQVLESPAPNTPRASVGRC